MIREFEDGVASSKGRRRRVVRRLQGAVVCLLFLIACPGEAFEDACRARLEARLAGLRAFAMQTGSSGSGLGWGLARTAEGAEVGFVCRDGETVSLSAFPADIGPASEDWGLFRRLEPEAGNRLQMQAVVATVTARRREDRTGAGARRHREWSRVHASARAVWQERLAGVRGAWRALEAVPRGADRSRAWRRLQTACGALAAAAEGLRRAAGDAPREGLARTLQDLAGDVEGFELACRDRRVFAIETWLEDLLPARLALLHRVESRFR